SGEQVGVFGLEIEGEIRGGDAEQQLVPFVPKEQYVVARLERWGAGELERHGQLDMVGPELGTARERGVRELARLGRHRGPYGVRGIERVGRFRLDGEGH